MSLAVRVLPLVHADGARNMAIDEALLRGAVEEPSRPVTLRFYGWSSPCVSVGCVQEINDLDLAACAAAGLPVVRRASGGTAVLHESTLGFSLVIPPNSSLAIQDIVESYRVFGAPVFDALARLGVDCRLAQPSEAHRGQRTPGPQGAVCFASIAPYECLCDGRKLTGHSQVRRRGAVLHHVLVPLEFDPARLAGLIRVESPTERIELSALLASRIAGLAGCASRPSSIWTSEAHGRAGRTDSGDSSHPSPPEATGDFRKSLVAGLSAAFAEAFDASFVEGDLTATESATVASLIADKYSNDEWTFRRSTPVPTS